MKLMQLVVMRWLAGTVCVKDLSGQMFSFPVQNDKARLRLTPSKQDFSAVTVCLRSFTDLKRDHVLFSLATPSIPNAFLTFWRERRKEMEFYVLNKVAQFPGLEYKLNTWHSICTTWDSTSGLMQLWFDGKPSIQKFATHSNITGYPNILIGQKQGWFGGRFDSQQSFVGMMCDIHMWDYVLSGCEIKNYVDELNFTPGNVLNWRALEHRLIDKVLIEEKITQCH